MIATAAVTATAAVVIAAQLRSLDSTDPGGEDPPVTHPTLRAAQSPAESESDLAAVARGAASPVSAPRAAGRTA